MTARDQLTGRRTMSPSYHTSKPAHWVSPRAHTDASLRFHAHGPLQPMAEERVSWLRRLLGGAK